MTEMPIPFDDDEDPDDALNSPVEPDIPATESGEFADFDDDPDAGDPTVGTVIIDPDQEDE